MLSFSIRIITRNEICKEFFKTTTSDILISNRKGEIFIIVATQKFEKIDLFYHSNFHKNTMIERIIESLSGIGIFIARLNPNLRYINETFKNYEKSHDVRMNKISPVYSPHLRVYDALTMNNLFCESCEEKLR